MSTFNESQILRGKPGNPGQFAGRVNSAPESELNVTPTETEKHIATVCDEAGYGGVMPGIFEVIRDRGDDGDPIFDALTASEVDDAYDDYIGPAIDGIEDRLALCLELGFYTDEGVRAHICEVCDEAGFGGVMPGVYQVAWDRHGSMRFAQALMFLREEDVNRDYDTSIGPAIGNIEDDLRQNHCSQCGESLADGANFGRCAGNRHG